LLYAALLYGLMAPVLIAIILHISNNKRIMRRFTKSSTSNILGFIALLIKTAYAIALIYLQLASDWCFLNIQETFS